jgi:exodeoxyribonuclease V alpha subunit
MDRITGSIERVTFHNAENGFVVLRADVAGRRGLVTVVGRTARAVAGEAFEAEGAWQEDPEHGLQFKAGELRTMPPHTPAAIEKYLASGLVKGIGPHYAHKIVKVFGPRTLQVIDESPAFLNEVKGLGPRRIERIRESWAQQRAVRNIMVFLQSHGIGTARALRIYKTYGERAVDTVREDPYRLATDIWGIGFQTADELAQRLGLDPQSVQRARAALRFVLQQASGEGHVALPEEAVVERAGGLTGISPAVLTGAAAELVANGELVREDTATPERWLYLRPLYHAESGCARRLTALLAGAHPLADASADAEVQLVEKRMGIAFAARQREAIAQALGQKVLVLTGGPGTGKTTIIRGILDIFAARDLRCALAAPTGRAARRLSEAAGRPAKTIHRLLEFDAHGPRRGQESPLEVDFLVVDEASMMDVVLADQLLRALPASACLLLVGDTDQLPSVGPGALLADIIASRRVPVVRLTEIFRQAQDSGIVRAAYAVHAGELPESASAASPGDFYFIEADAPAAIVERIITMLRDRIPARFGLDPLRDVQVLTPMNRFDLGARALNAKLQEVFNPPQEGPEAVRFGWTFRIGDKVLQTANNYQKDVFNGDIGRITRIDDAEHEVHVDFDGRSVAYDFDELDELALAYALTVHKSQGAEYPAVIVPLHAQQYRLLQRNLLYTAITRGKRLVVVVGTRKALQLAVSRGETALRYTALAARLREQSADS